MASTPVLSPVSTELADLIYRQMSEQELLAVLDGKVVPGLDEDDPVVQLLRIGLPTKPARTAFAMARRAGYLQIDLGYGLYPDAWVVRHLEEIWTIWCVVRNHPPITLTGMPDGEGRLACDLAPLERGWTDEERDRIEWLLGRARPGFRVRLTGTALEVDGMAVGDAVALARGLVWIGTDGRFRVMG